MANNLFAGAFGCLFDAVGKTFGVPATWAPSNLPETEHAATVLFKSPSEASQLVGIEYQPETFYIDFKASDFPGLKTLVDQKKNEVVNIEGVAYLVQNVHAIFDGANYLAELVTDN